MRCENCPYWNSETGGCEIEDPESECPDETDICSYEPDDDE